MDSWGQLCLVFVSLSFVGIVCPEVRDWCVRDASVTINAVCSEDPPSLPDFPGSCFAPTTTERATTAESETTGFTTDVTATDVTPTDVTATDVTATDATATDATATDVTVTEITVTEITVTEVTPTEDKATEVTATEVTVTEGTPTEGTPTEVTTETTVTGVTRSFPTSAATGICCNTHTTEPPEATTGPGPGSGTTGGISPNVLRRATIWTGAVSAVVYILVALCLCYIFVKNAVSHNKVHPGTQERNDEGQENKTENGFPGQPSSETEEPVPSSFQKMLQGSLTIGVLLQVQVWLILIAVSLAVVFVLIIIGVVLAVKANYIASLVIFAICIVTSLAFYVLLVKKMYDKPKKRYDEEDVCLEDCPEKTEGLQQINEGRPIENEPPIENELPSSASSSQAGRVVTTPHGKNQKENGDDRNRKISSGSQAGDTTLLVTVDTNTMYRKPRKKKKKRESRPSIELGELRLPGARSSYGHISNEHTT